MGIMQKLYLVGIIIVLVFGVFWFGGLAKQAENEDDRVRVVTSFYPLYFFTKEIGGGQVTVENLTPAGTEPHDYELTPRNIVALRESRLLVINGELEPWKDKIDWILSGQGPQVVEVGDGIIRVTEFGPGAVDPHIWLSPRLAKVMVESIAQGLVRGDQVNSDEYLTNAKRLLSELDRLDSEFKQGLARCKRREMVVAHTAFGYLALDYGLVQVGIAGLSPDEEPSIKRMAEVASLVKSKEVKTIFFERILSPKLAETIATETGATSAVLDPLEGLTVEDQNTGSNYLSVMRVNLVNLREALECQ